MKENVLGEIRRTKEESFLKEKRSLTLAINSANARGEIAIIAELKRASPSSGLIDSMENVGAGAKTRTYESCGASAISVLTEPSHFNGSLNDLLEASKAVKIPVMRKDFLIERWELIEAKCFGADAVLLIADLLGENTREMLYFARSLGLEVLVEAHSKKALSYAIESGAEIIGINSRNLKTLKVDLATFEELAPLVPKECLLVAESGITDAKDLARVAKAGANAALIGTAISKSKDSCGFLKTLREVKYE